MFQYPQEVKCFNTPRPKYVSEGDGQNVSLPSYCIQLWWFQTVSTGSSFYYVRKKLQAIPLILSGWQSLK